MSVYLFHRLTPAIRIDITYSNDSAIFLLQESFDVPQSHAAQADHSHRQSIARSRLIITAQNNIRNSNGRDGAFQKTTPGNCPLYLAHGRCPENHASLVFCRASISILIHTPT